MSNHYHVVLRVDRHKAADWNDKQVAKHWKMLYNWPLLVCEYTEGKTESAETSKAQEFIHSWRERLSDIFWFMPCLNEYLARIANKEDNCTVKFREGRYKCQALLGEAAVLTCMAYVDLNPIRAGIVNTPKASDYTSIQQRIGSLTKPMVNQRKRHNANAFHKVRLMPLVKQSRDRHPNAIVYTLKNYLELIDWIGRSKRNDKRGSIEDRSPPILQRLELNADDFVDHVLTYEDQYFYPVAMSPIAKLKNLANHWKQKFIKGQHRFKRIYTAL